MFGVPSIWYSCWSCELGGTGKAVPFQLHHSRSQQAGTAPKQDPSPEWALAFHEVSHIMITLKIIYLLEWNSNLFENHWIFSRIDGKDVRVATPRTPKAPKHGPRPSRFKLLDVKPITAVLFPDSLPSKKRRLRRLMPPGLPRPVPKAAASPRVLLYEEELCEAVAQNKLLWSPKRSGLVAMDWHRFSCLIS